MKYVLKITIPFLIIILCAFGVTLVAADGYGVLDSGASGSANVMSASSGIADNVMNTLPSEDESGNVINPSSDKLDNSSLVNSLPSVDEEGNVINPSSDKLDNSSLVNSLPSVDEEGNVKNPSSEGLGNVMNSLPSEKKIGSGNKDLKVYYLNTSYGDATLLESSGHFMLINAGDTKDSSAVIDYLNGTGVSMLDYAIATNLEDSAIGGMKNIMETFPVSIFSSPSNTFSSPTYDKIKTMIEEKEIGFDQATSGISLPFGDASIVFMNTSTSKTNASENAMSVLVKTGNVTFLFTGNQNLGTSPATVWAVPYNTGQEALALSEFSPEALVINPGPSGTDQTTLTSLKKLNLVPLLTNIDGNIVVSTDGNEYQITTSSGKTFQKPDPVVNTTTQASSVKNATSPDAKTSIGIATNSVI